MITNEPVKMSISTGNTIEDKGNHFASYSSSADSLRQVRMSIINIMRQQGVSSASQNIYAYRFKSSDGIIHEGSEDDGEVGAGRALLRTLAENDIQNSVVVVARWFGSKIGARRFPHIKNSGISAVKGLLASATSEQSQKNQKVSTDFFPVTNHQESNFCIYPCMSCSWLIFTFLYGIIIEI